MDVKQATVTAQILIQTITTNPLEMMRSEMKEYQIIQDKFHPRDKQMTNEWHPHLRDRQVVLIFTQTQDGLCQKIMLIDRLQARQCLQM